jgi:GTP-binding protein
MKFVDETTIIVSAGSGGDGALSFRREKFLPKGGPDGGNGGKGGDVVLVVEPGLNTLSNFRYTRTFRASDGSRGAGKNCTGSTGANCEVQVPIGTLVFDADSNELITDMTDGCQRSVVAYGGKGGVGNAHFKSSTNRAPRRTTLGKIGEERRLHLELQVLADVGLLGFPNAGKSTLLRAVSSATPKVGEYPFTTLYPQLGIVERESDRFVMADIPGLIKGAATGAGLGISFLRHLRRTRLLLHVVDIGTEKSSDSINAIRAVERELKAFDEELATRSRWMILNKADLVAEDEAERVATELIGTISWTGPWYVISAATGEGCASMMEDIFSWIAKTQQDGLWP